LNENPDYFHSGFIARFLIAMPPVEAIKLNPRELTDAEKKSYERFIMDILSARESMLVDGKVEPKVFPISPGAWNVLIDYQHRHAELSVYETDRNSAVEGKFLTNAARIALILHVARLTENGTHWKDYSPVSEETMKGACIIAEWFVQESKRVFAVLSGDYADGELTTEQREVLMVLQGRNKPMTSSEVRFANRRTQRIDVEKTLAELLKAGLIQDGFREHEGGGRTTIEYRIADTSAVSVSGIVKNTGENCNSTYTDTIVAEKNADPDTEVIEGFEYYQNPESPSDSVEQHPCVGAGNEVEKRRSVSGYPLHTETDYAEMATVLAGF
jgi:predicted transcriptional regulator